MNLLCFSTIFEKKKKSHPKKKLWNNYWKEVIYLTCLYDLKQAIYITITGRPRKMLSVYQSKLKAL